MNAGPAPVWVRQNLCVEAQAASPGGVAQKTTSSQNKTNGDVSLKRGPFPARAVNSLLPGC